MVLAYLIIFRASHYLRLTGLFLLNPSIFYLFCMFDLIKRRIIQISDELTSKNILSIEDSRISIE